MKTKNVKKVDLTTEPINSLVKFIYDTKDGKYTESKPDTTEVKYMRINIQEQDVDHQENSNPEELLFFGVSY